jgi:hypothetical protein
LTVVLPASLERAALFLQSVPEAVRSALLSRAQALLAENSPERIAVAPNRVEFTLDENKNELLTVFVRGNARTTNTARWSA